MLVQMGRSSVRVRPSVRPSATGRGEKGANANAGTTFLPTQYLKLFLPAAKSAGRACMQKELEKGVVGSRLMPSLFANFYRIVHRNTIVTNLIG